MGKKRGKKKYNGKGFAVAPAKPFFNVNPRPAPSNVKGLLPSFITGS